MTKYVVEVYEFHEISGIFIIECEDSKIDEYLRCLQQKRPKYDIMATTLTEWIENNTLSQLDLDNIKNPNYPCLP